MLDKGLAQLSTDDSFSTESKSGGEAERSTKLLQCYGGRPTFTDIEPHQHKEPCVAGSTYLRCSDGWYETLAEEPMRSLIGTDLVASCEALMTAALEANARDNTTVALVRILG